MKHFSLIDQTIQMILFVLFMILGQSAFAQTVNELEAEIESYEQKMTALEKQISVNNTTNNASANPALEKKIEGYENEIEVLLDKIKRINAGLPDNSDELELMALQKELQATEDIVEDLEKEIGTLNKEIQRLTVQGGGSGEIEKLQNRVKKLQNENQILKKQIIGYRKSSKIRSNSNSNNNTKVAKLEGQLKTLRTKNKQLQQQANNGGARNALNNNHFLKQFRVVNTTNLVFGYRYTVLPNINFKTSPSLLQGTKKVGTLLPLADLSAAGHYGFMGVEFLFHDRHVGGNVGLTANYAYNEGIDITMHTAYFQLSGELTILPLRLGIKGGVNVGYTFGQIMNHSALLNDHSVQNNPEFSTLVVGFDTKVRLYLSRYIAFAGYFGADYALSGQFETDSWNTMFRYGIGIDFIIPLKRT
jgi:predicted  nucleic acid-binding Zn-ribbon protein